MVSYCRKVENTKLSPEKKSFEIFDEGTEKEFNYNGFCQAAKITKRQNIGSRVVPIVPDEARTFGMDSLFRQLVFIQAKGKI